MDSPYDMSYLAKKPNFQPTQLQEVILPSIMYKLKTYLSPNSGYFQDTEGKN